MELMTQNAMRAVAITIYVVIQLEFVVRVVKNRPVQRDGEGEMTLVPGEKGKTVTDVEGGGLVGLLPRPVIPSKTRLMLLGLVLSTVLIYVRSIYRTIEVRRSKAGRGLCV